jgi:hypothetical protein
MRESLTKSLLATPSGGRFGAFRLYATYLNDFDERRGAAASSP